MPVSTETFSNEAGDECHQRNAPIGRISEAFLTDDDDFASDLVTQPY